VKTNVNTPFEPHATPSQILLFDGVCNLCTEAVQYVLRWERDPVIIFASLQSEIGQQLLTQYNLSTTDFNSLVFIDNGHAYTQSDGALRLAKYFKKPWCWLYFFRFVPRFIRNFVYKTVADYRYQWFGKQDVCMMPTPDLRKRFL
jgi:predicted DCC family thiol-disulfide oxidoreductase YuxK